MFLLVEASEKDARFVEGRQVALIIEPIDGVRWRYFPLP